MNDSIDRQQAIDGLDVHYIERINLNDWQAGWNAALDWMKDVYLDDLPSAQLAQYLTKGCTDTISRQAIDTDGLDEEIRCEMCRNPMHTDRGCDGNCKYDEKLYERIMQILGERIKPLPSARLELIRCKDCKHKPYPSDNYDYDNSGFEIIFPDYRCPCRCDDEYYNRIPDDDWFCGSAERKEE